MNTTKHTDLTEIKTDKDKILYFFKNNLMAMSALDVQLALGMQTMAKVSRRISELCAMGLIHKYGTSIKDKKNKTTYSTYIYSMPHEIVKASIAYKNERTIAFLAEGPTHNISQVLLDAMHIEKMNLILNK